MKLNSIIEKIDQQREEINKHGKLNTDVLNKINYKLRLDWNYYSNRMEGGTLTQAETRSVMVGNIDVKGKPFKDVMEMNGHDRTVLDILKLGKGEQRISEKRIKAIHSAIMFEDDPEKKKGIGEWKLTPNEIINYKNEKIDFALPYEVPDKVHTILDKINAELDAYFSGKPSKHPLELASQFHIDFVTIHPFYDGNGRTTRILMNIILVSCGYPPVVIKDAQKKSYYQLLADIQVYGGKADLFQAFIGERLIESQQLVLDAIAGKSIEEEGDFDKEIEMLQQKQTLPVIKVEKSYEVMKDILENVYLPLLKELDEKLINLNVLFEEQKWTYYEEHSDPDYKKSFLPKSSNLQTISNYFRKINEITGDSSQNYKASYWLLDYKDSNNFSLEIALRLYFFEHDFKIEVYIGRPNGSIKNIQRLNDIMKKIVKDDDSFSDSVNFDIVDREYGRPVAQEETKEWIKEIAKQTLIIIKSKSEKI